jgi:cytosine/adenosine deaminase-related metal-dependent hydrolase
LIAREGLLGPDHNVVHGNYLDDAELQVIVDTGASVTATPGPELQKNPVEPLVGRVAALGGYPSIGADHDLNIASDMFQVMRFALQAQRMLNNQKIAKSRAPIEKQTVVCREALAWATINNARALGMADRIGSLTPGKQADIVTLRTSDINMFPVNEPIQSAVFQANRSNVDTVWIAGRKVKQGGRLLYPAAALEKKKQQLLASGRRIFKEGEYDPHRLQ